MIIETLKRNYNCGEENLEYIYNLIEGELKLHNGKEKYSIKAYGVEIESIITNHDKIVHASREEVKYITPYKFKGREFLNMLEKNMVSPIHLLEITEELIEDYYKDFDKEHYIELAKVTV